LHLESRQRLGEIKVLGLALYSTTFEALKDRALVRALHFAMKLAKYSHPDHAVRQDPKPESKSIHTQSVIEPNAPAQLEQELEP
jgi:hypothetical protein